MSRAKSLRGHQLRKAVKGGDVQAVKNLIGDGIDLKLKDHKSGWTALHYAVDGESMQHYDIAKLLIQAGADVNAQNHDGDTPFHLAAQRGDSAMIDLILTANPKIHITNKKGDTALMVVPHGRTDLKVKIVSWERRNQVQAMLFGSTRMDLNSTTRIGEDKRLQKGRTEGQEELRAAAADGDVDGVKEVLAFFPDIDIDAQDEYGWSALHYSAFQGHAEIVIFLLKENAIPNLRERKNQQTPLHLAAGSGSSRTVEALLNLADSFEIDVEDNQKQTPLFIAASKGHAEVTRVMLEHDANCAVVDYLDRTPLFIAALEGHEGVVEAILGSTKPGDRPLDVNARDINGRTALHAAGEEGNVEVGQMLIQGGGNLEAEDGSGGTPLFVASAMGHARFVHMMLQFDANPDHANSNWETPLYVASKRGHVAVVQWLLKHKADTEQHLLKDGSTPLMAAAQEGRIAVMSHLVSKSAKIHAANYKGETPLLIASAGGYSNAVAFLIQNGADILETNIQGHTALHIAAQNGHTGVVRVLLAVLESKIPTNAGGKASPEHWQPDTRGETPLHLASKYGHMSVVEQLLFYDKKISKQRKTNSSPGLIYGAMIDLPNKFGWTALHSAVDGMSYGSISILLQYNANVNAPDTHANTPLHIAARRQDSRLVGMLLSAGADISAVNSEGLTALHCASSCGRPNTLRMLLDVGADPRLKDKKGLNAHGVLESRDNCNPAYVFQGLCNRKIEGNTTYYSGDMCPVVMGTENDFREADLLLQVAMNKSVTNSILNTPRDVPPDPVNIQTNSKVNVTLAATLAPAAFLVLFFLAIALAVYRRVQKKESPELGDNAKGNREKVPFRKQTDSSNSPLQPGEGTSQGFLTSPRKASYLDAQFDRCVLPHGENSTDGYLNSPEWAYVSSQQSKAISEVSSGEDTCGWSDSSEETGDRDDSARGRSGQCPNSKNYDIARKSSYLTLSECSTEDDDQDEI